MSAGVFNTPVECAIRVGAILTSLHPQSLDIHKLAHLDYILVHSSDVGGPSSLHPATPLRSGEWLVRRELIRAGLRVLVHRGLVSVSAGEEGIHFIASDHLAPCLRLLHSSYTKMLMARAAWIASTYGGWSEPELRELLHTKVKSLGPEFEIDALPMEEPL